MSGEATAPLDSASESQGGEGTEQPTGTVLDRYVLLGVVGRGGAGTVYAAYDSVLDRKVALKLLAGHADSRWAAVVREARMLAKVNHSAVVTVYDVGQFDGVPFVAMEFVGGGDLDSTRTEKPALSAVLDRWVAAAKGLAAAHGAGVIHGDFKPANVLLDHAGQPKVSDFGIARALAAVPSESSPGHAEPDDDSRLRASTTESGPRRVGTPIYMAPEQLDGEPATVASDIYALCVTLAQMIEGEPPWKSVHGRDDATKELTGRLQRDRSVPAWLVSVIERGLAEHPAARWRTVASLLDEVERHRTRTRRISPAMVLGVSASVLGLGAYAMWAQPAPADLCAEGPTPIDEVWSPSIADSMAERWQALEQVGADHAWGRLRNDVDAYVETWRDAYASVCTAASADPVAGRAMTCLRRRSTSLGAALQVLAEPTNAMVFDAHTAIDAIPPVGDGACTDPARLAAAEHALPDEAARRIDRAHGFAAAGSFSDALAEADVALEESEAHPTLPMLRAEALYASAVALTGLGRHQLAYDRLREAYFLALRHESDLVAPLAGTLATQAGSRLDRVDEGLVWAEHAEIERRNRGEPVGPILSVRASLLTDRGELEESIALQKEALELLRDEEASPRRVGTAHHRLGTALRIAGKYEEANRHWERAAELYADELGEDHPHLWQTRNGIALTTMQLGDLAAAQTQLEEVVSQLSRILGPDHPELTASLTNLAMVQAEKGDHQAALREFDRSVEILERQLGADNLRVAKARQNVATALGYLERTDEALVEFEKILSVYDRELPRDHPDQYYARYGYAAALMNAGRPAEGVEQFERARKAALVALPEHLDLAEVEIVLGETTKIAGRPAAESIAWYRSAIERLRGRPEGADLLARAEAGLAKLQEG